MEQLVEQLGVTRLSKSQVSEMARSLDEQVTAFRTRPLDASPDTLVWVDALTQRVREGGRTVLVHALVAVGVNNDGQREVLGLDVVSGEDGARWLAFLRGLVARGLTGVALVTSDSHPADACPVRLAGPTIYTTGWTRPQRFGDDPRGISGWHPYASRCRVLPRCSVGCGLPTPS